MADQPFTYPDQTQWVRPAGTVGYYVSDYYSAGGDFDRPNWVGDTMSSGLHNPAHLLIPNSNPPAYGDCQFDRECPNQFASGNGWIHFKTETHPIKFRGSDFKCQVGSEGEWGGWQGPYTDPPFYP